MLLGNGPFANDTHWTSRLLIDVGCLTAATLPTLGLMLGVTSIGRAAVISHHALPLLFHLIRDDGRSNVSGQRSRGARPLPPELDAHFVCHPHQM
jgi:hypothetical protein